MESNAPPDLVSSLSNFVYLVWNGVVERFAIENVLIEVATILGVVVLAFLLTLISKPLCRRITEAIEERNDWIEGIVDWLADHLFRIFLVGLLWMASWILDSQVVDPLSWGKAEEGQAVEVVSVLPTGDALVGQSELGLSSEISLPRNFIFVRAFASLATLFLFVNALPARLHKTAYFRILFFFLAIGLALNLVGLWVPVRDGLNSLKLLPVTESTETRVTVLSLIKGMIAILLLVPACRWLLRLLDSRIDKMDAVSPVLQVLLTKVVTVLVVILAVLFGLSSLGVNLSALAVLGGAIGLGLGFGFQKVVSNLVSGIILLTDRSIKPGDVIEVGDTYGWINKLSARYVSVITRDGMEHLIPNETLITEKVTNWSFSDSNVRVRVPFGASYNADPREVMAIAVEAGKACKRVIAEKEPVCWMLGYGDSAVDYELRVWIRDPSRGIGNLRSEIYLRIWDEFKERGIEIPFPQRDLHIRDGASLKVDMERGDGSRD